LGLLTALSGISSTVGALGGRAVAMPLVTMLEAALRELVDEALDARPLVRGAELDALDGRARTLQDAITAASSELAAVVQALDARDDSALAEALGIGDVPEAVSRLEHHRAALTRRADRLLGALDVAAERIETLAGRLAAYGSGRPAAD
jgi:hypothetical protein